MPDDQERMVNFIETSVPNFMKQGKIPGLSLAVVRDGETVYAEGFGARNKAKNLPATPATLYGIGSCTKSFVAMGIMQLVEQGKISLKDPIRHYLPLHLETEEPITIHHLLTHASGIPSLATSLLSISRGLGVGEPGIPWGGVNDFYRFINDADEEITDEPGKRFFYFNAGYRMLGHLIQTVSGEPFHTYIEEHILRPLQMERTTLSKAQYKQDGNRMTPYWKKPGGKMEVASFPYPNAADNPDFSFILAAGGIIASVKELTNYLTVNMEQGKFNGTQLISSSSIEKMQTLYIERPPRHFGSHGYGYGWDVTEDFFGHKLISHGGSILVSTAHLDFLPELGIGVAMAANSKGFPYAAVAQGIFATLLGKDPKEEVPSLKIKERMKTLTGTYETYKGLNKVNITEKDGLLYFEKENPFTEMCVPLIPQEDTLESYKFYILSEGVRTPIEFVMQGEGKIDLYIGRYRYHKVHTEP